MFLLCHKQLRTVRACHFVLRSHLWVLEVTAQCDLDVVNKHAVCLSV